MKPESLRAALRDPRYRWQLLIVLLALGLVLAAFANFLGFNESRPGARLNDPVLALFPAVDLTWVTFTLIYVSLLAAVVSLLRHPRPLLVALGSYALMASVRMTMMYLTPLDPPEGLIPLVDPFIEFFGTGTTVNKDLFFSGHTSTLFLLYLTAVDRRLRALFLTCTILVAACVLAQHVHYTIDVAVAPFVAYVCWNLVVRAVGGRNGE